MAVLPKMQPTCEELQRAAISNPFLFSVLLLSFLLFLHKWRRDGKFNLPPSPPKLPLLGNLHQLGKLPHRSLQALSKKYGPLMLLNFGTKPNIVVSSMEIAREVMTTHDIVCSNRPKTTAADIFLYGCRDVAFSPYGEYWRQLKKLCVLELLSAKRVRSFGHVRDEEVSILIDKIRGCCLSGASVNLSEMLLEISNNIVSRSVVGRKADEGKFGELSRRILVQFVAFSFADTFPSLGWMDSLTGLTSQWKATFREIDAFLDQVIEEHRKVESDRNQFDRKDFVHIILELQNNGMLGFQLTQDNMKTILIDMFVGGTETTATAMEWTIAELAKDQNAMKKAQEEVRRVVGKKPKVEVDDVDQMHYLKCVIKESLRLHPPLPLLLPREPWANIDSSGYTIPSKTTVLVSALAVHMDPKVWECPEKFMPERFEDKPVDYKVQDFKFLPFGGGRRGCPGITFAMASAEYVLANLLYWFDWKLTSENMDMTEAFGLTVTKKIPLRLIPTTMYHP